MKKPVFLFLLIASLVSSCNLPATGGGTSPEIATAAALTVQAALTPLGTPVADASATSESLSKPVITVLDPTNCRTGPGTNYERVTQITAGQQVEIVGSFPPGYWIVSTNAGLCWVSAEFATPAGSFQAVPTVTAPATPEGSAPSAIGFQQWEIFCNFQTDQADIMIRWSDKSNDEAGFRVYRNGTVVAEVPANSTQFNETITLLSGQSVGYRVESFNEVGSASTSTISLAC